MVRFEDVGLRGKLFGCFVISGGVLVLAILFCLLQIRSVGEQTGEIARNWLPSIQQGGEISQLRLRYRVRSLEFMLAASDEERGRIGDSLVSLDKQLQEALRKYEPLIESAEERKVFVALGAAVAQYRDLVTQAIDHARAGRLEEAQRLRRTDWVKAADAVRDQTDALLKINRSGSEAAAERALAEERYALRWGVAALLLGLALAVVTTFLVSRSLARRLDTSLHAAQKIAAGDLTGEMPASSGDEVGRLVAAMQEMQSALRQALRETRDNAQAINACSQDLSAAVSEIEQAAQEQSDAASAIAANVEEVTVSIVHVTDTTRDASRIAREAGAQAAHSNDGVQKLGADIGEVAEVVGLAAERIGRLEGESQRISNIVAVIKDIADQTNLLALNAAIEAARAGEAGRGFAVVADEVRKLSERTALSTGEIEQMVSAIQVSTREVIADVRSGVDLVGGSVTRARETAAVLAKMQGMSEEVASLVARVDDAMREQSVASTEVARKVEGVATHAEAATAVAQRTATAAASLRDTARDMETLVQRFRV